MPIQKFFIGPFDKGQITRFKPWLVPEKAFVQLRNAFQWRGSIKKRIGAHPMNPSKDLANQQQFTRLRVDLGTSTGVAINLPGNINQLEVGQMFSTDDTYLTINQLGAGVSTLSTDDPTVTAVIDSTVNPNTVTITGANGQKVYYYPTKPVMKFAQYNVTSINDEETFAFDTQFSYRYTVLTGWKRESTETVAGDSVWTGTDSDFYWTCNYRGPASNDFYLFVTNNNPGTVASPNDIMRYWDGTHWNSFGSATTTLLNSANDYLVTCKCIVPFQNRLITANVTEYDAGTNTYKTYINRIDFSALGNPIGTTPWLRDVLGKGGFIEVPLKEAITSLEFIKDRLIVKCEQSVWELIGTGNANQPFILQQINSEIGSESMNSSIAFDRDVLDFGSTGIHDNNGVNVQRIDEEIPDVIFDISNSNNGIERVGGIRDFYNELAYWTYPSVSRETGFNEIYPNRLITFNYVDKTWSFNDDSITALGHFQISSDLTWGDVEATWGELDSPWDSGNTQAKFRSVIGGNQQGYTFIMSNNYTVNSIGLQITNATISSNQITFTSYNHNLAINSYVYIQNIVDDGTIGDIVNNHIFKVNDTPDKDTFTIIVDTVPTGTYQGGGVITLVTPHDIITKSFNFFYQSASKMALHKIDFYIDKSANISFDDNGDKISGGGETTVTYFLSSSTTDSTRFALEDGGIYGTSILETTPYDLVPEEKQQSRFWHSLYPNYFGENIQIRLYLTEDQITTGNTAATPTAYTAFQDFQLNAMIFHAEEMGELGV